MSPLTRLAVAGLLAASVACYHATIETGLAPSNRVVEKPFASAWINGLVPPSPISTISQCPNGAAKVETQLSFVNMLVAALTASIYTPMHIKVTCAEGASAASQVPAPSTRE